jgi:molybdopterin-guanine dinucleotide biosynthesis adapter protein
MKRFVKKEREERERGRMPVEAENNSPAILSIVGKSEAGKTTLIEKMLPCLVRRGIKVGTIKHDVHGFTMDREGKDSYRHKQAGAHTTVISSPNKIGMVRDADHDHAIKEIVDLYLKDMNLVLTEGYKRESWPKLEVHRRELKRSLIAKPEEGLIAVASDEELDVNAPVFGLDDVEQISDFLISYFKLHPEP